MGLTFLDFFAGAGLVALALSDDWKCVWANDIDPRKARVYESNFGRRHFHLGDVADVNADSLPQGVDMAWASFPCQDLSLAGWRRGMTARRSGTFWEFWRIMNELSRAGHRPPLIVLENVIGLLHHDDFAGLCDALTALGLQFGALVIDAVHFLPQSRPRVFIVAVDARLDCSAYTGVWLNDEPWFPESLRRAWTKLSEASARLWRWWRLPLPDHENVVDVSDLIEDGDHVVWDSTEETSKLLALMTEDHRAKVEHAIASGDSTVGFLYKRTRNGRQRAEVRFDGVAGCLRTPGGGSSRQTVMLVKRGCVRTRLLTPREAARLMGVPDTFDLPGSYNDGYRAMGDAVAVPAVRWLSKNLLVPLAYECQRSAYGLTDPRALQGDIVEPQKTAHQLADLWRQNNAI